MIPDRTGFFCLLSLKYLHWVVPLGEGAGLPLTPLPCLPQAGALITSLPPEFLGRAVSWEGAGKGGALASQVLLSWVGKSQGRGEA